MIDLDRLGGTRFVLAILTSISATTLLWFTKVDPSTYSLIILGTVGAYIAADTTQNIKHITTTGSVPEK